MVHESYCYSNTEAFPRQEKCDGTMNKLCLFRLTNISVVLKWILVLYTYYGAEVYPFGFLHRNKILYEQRGNEL